MASAEPGGTPLSRRGRRTSGCSRRRNRGRPTRRRRPAGRRRRRPRALKEPADTGADGRGRPAGRETAQRLGAAVSRSRVPGRVLEEGREEGAEPFPAARVRQGLGAHWAGLALRLSADRPGGYGSRPGTVGGGGNRTGGPWRDGNGGEACPGQGPAGVEGGDAGGWQSRVRVSARPASGRPRGPTRVPLSSRPRPGSCAHASFRPRRPTPLSPRASTHASPARPPRAAPPPTAPAQGRQWRQPRTTPALAPPARRPG